MFGDILSKAADIASMGAEAMKKGAEAVKKAEIDANTISEDSPFIVSGLEIYPNKLKYKNILYSFDEIVLLGWDRENWRDAELTIYFENGESFSINKSTSKLEKAYNYIARKTFERRLEDYTDQLNKRGYFRNWDDQVKFFTDGIVEKGDKTYNLSEAKLEESKLIIKPGGMFSSEVSVDLSFHKDVILALINFILENPQKPSVYVENYKKQQKEKREQSPKNLFLPNVISLMAKLSFSDGVVSSEETDVVKEFLINTMKIDNMKLLQMMSTFHEAKNSPKPFEYFASKLAHNYEQDMLSAILDVLFLLAIADGNISAEEELLLFEAETIFGIEGSMYNEYKNQGHTQKSNKKEYYLNILGLSTNATQDEIKKTYRRLAMKFHPDKVSHLGEDFIILAEVKIKEINEAYETLKDY